MACKLFVIALLQICTMYGSFHISYYYLFFQVLCCEEASYLNVPFYEVDHLDLCQGMKDLRIHLLHFIFQASNSISSANIGRALSAELIKSSFIGLRRCGVENKQ